MRIHAPATLDDALDLLAAGNGDAPVPLAGGTDLLVHWPTRLDAHERDYLDVGAIEDLPPTAWSDDALVLGAGATYWEAIVDPAIGAAFPLLIDAARQVGAVQIQARGTWAGNVVNGSPAADGVPVLMAYDATVVLASRDGTREVPLDAYYTGYREGARKGDEIVVAIRLPRRAHDVQAFVKVGPRRAQAIAKVGLALTRSDEGWRVVAASVAPTVRRCRAVERMLADGVPLPHPDALLPALCQDVQPIDDLRSTAAYRERVMARVLWHALADRDALP